MKKKNFVTLIMSVVGGILFALGMCMALLPEWGAMTQGIVIGAVGAVILLAMVPVRRKMDGKPMIVLTGKTIGAALLGVLGAIVLGIGMCMVMILGYAGSRHYRGHCWDRPAALPDPCDRRAEVIKKRSCAARAESVRHRFFGKSFS